MTVEDVNVTLTPNTVESCGLSEATQESFLNATHFFVNKIIFFFDLSRKICFTAMNHLSDRTVP